MAFGFATKAKTLMMCQCTYYVNNAGNVTTAKLHYRYTLSISTVELSQLINH